VISRKRLICVLQPAQVAAGASGFLASEPIKGNVYLDTVIVETDTPSGLVLVNFGVAPLNVTTTEEAALGQSGIDDIGSAINLPDGLALPLPNGSAYLTSLNWWIPNSYQRFFVQVINNQATDATRCHATFMGYYLTDSEYMDMTTGRTSPPQPPQPGEIATSGRLTTKPITPP
jgi:hypothetical protein